MQISCKNWFMLSSRDVWISIPVLVIVKDQHVSGNETSPGCFSTAATTVDVVVPAAELVLFLTPAGRPRFLGDEAFFPALIFAGALFDSIMLELNPSVIVHKKLKCNIFKNNYWLNKLITRCRFCAFAIAIFFFILGIIDNLASSLHSHFRLRWSTSRTEGRKEEMYHLLYHNH